MKAEQNKEDTKPADLAENEGGSHRLKTPSYVAITILELVGKIKKYCFLFFRVHRVRLSRIILENSR